MGGMTFFRTWILWAFLGSLVPCAASALSGDIPVTMPGQREAVNGHYDVQWGHFDPTKDGREPNILDREFWRWRPWTWTFVGTIEVPVPGGIVCRFQKEELTYTNQKWSDISDFSRHTSRELSFEAP